MKNKMCMNTYTMRLYRPNERERVRFTFTLYL